MLTFQVERFKDIADEVKPLLKRHWEEIAMDRDTVPMDMDYTLYGTLDSLGMLHITTVRAEGKLVGYYWNLVKNHPHYAGTLFAFVDIYWLAPEHRGLGGVRLFQEMERNMRALGVRKITSMSKLDHDVSPLFKLLGWTAAETTYSKVLA